ncbi:hypothetical protein PC129_g18855 [Phytophthora cactorum]|uniref:Alcohol dehydrogenase-like C-terminal domain-containing protein n=1 Tax=Phytophthora cactorum TaxID=29920 RepID=A0A329RH43_9STRA|nr:hypothetical protein Pcac1_g16048 [Phytophthora cactorum]KAG2800385.1 hypothetical protein PC111_g19992 [Phytophthora cactorum]KAG2830608.1 hypothetical protein PC112_g7598 [Phytophthora cactorum]KAG2833717.1 hypothetical protein PC113_g20521 [Phytophthora cactorum]KAG2879142.1 hypothetical protein PC114_g22725 [Phytophthora cactorum]
MAGSFHVIRLYPYGKLQNGQRVLILGGSRGTGLFGIHIAKALGAKVITTCSARNAELVKSLGADQTVLKEKTGIFATIGVIDKPIESPIDATLHQIFSAPCTGYLQAGKVNSIDSVHPLENVMEAFKVKMSCRARGKIIIEIAKE